MKNNDLLHYSVRITSPDITEILTLLHNRASNFLVCKETADDKIDNTHYHLYFTSTRKHQTIRDVIRPYGKGNEFYSLKTIAEDEVHSCLKYICKGIICKVENKILLPPNIIINHNNNYKIKELQQEYIEYRKELLKANLKVESKRNKSSIPVAMKIYNLIEKKLLKMNPLNPHCIACLIVKDYYKRHVSPPSKFNMEGLIDYILLRYEIEHKQKPIQEAIDRFCYNKYQYESYNQEWDTEEEDDEDENIEIETIIN